jgi:hypothetical protein
MIEQTHRKEFRVKRFVKTVPDEGGSSRELWVTSEPLYGVLTNVNTTDVESFSSNVLSRQKRLRIFSDLSVSYKDKVVIDGEEWSVVGEPETVSSTTNPRDKSTVIMLTKEGKG